MKISFITIDSECIKIKYSCSTEKAVEISSRLFLNLIPEVKFKYMEGNNDNKEICFYFENEISEEEAEFLCSKLGVNNV